VRKNAEEKMPDHRTSLHRTRAGATSLAEAEASHLGGNPFRLVHQHDMRAGRYVVRVETAHSIPDEFTALLAAVLADARFTLDELARELTGDAASKIRFPIHESLHAFAQRSRKPLSRMSDEAQATIEELQPYHAIGGFTRDPLWLLDALLSEGGARLAAGAVTGGEPLGVNSCRKIVISGDLEPVCGPFESRAVIAAAETKIVGPDPKIDLFLRPEFALAFSARGPARGGLVGDTIDSIVERVTTCVASLQSEVPVSST
jgi:hypothetical protein